MKKTAIYGIILMATTLAACTEDITISNGIDDGRIHFTVTMADSLDGISITRAIATQDTLSPIVLCCDEGQPLYLHRTVERFPTGTTTRSTMINNVGTDLKTLGCFGVSGYHYDPTTQSVNSVNANFFYNAKATQVDSEWSTSEPYYFPASNERMSFFAYAPYTATGGTYDVTQVYGDGPTELGPMILSYTVNPDVTEQTDLITAATHNLTFAQGSNVQLHFSHALTAIRFTLGSDVTPGWTLKELSIENVINHARYKVGTGWLTNESDATRGDFKLSLSKQTGDADRSVTGSTQTFLMIPQTFSPNNMTQRLTIKLEKDGTTKALHHLLEGETWTAGTMITYAITTSSINMVTPEIEWPTDWDGEKVLTEENYIDQEKVGVYAVNIGTGEIVIKNMAVEYDASTGKWNTGVDDELKYNANYDYYAYYPYKSGLSTVRNANGATYSGSADAKEFFADVISGWTPSTGNQNTRALFCANDLQIALATPHSDGAFGHLRFPMQHAMGLAVVNLESKTITATVRYFADDYNSSSAYYDIPNLEMVVTATPKLSGGEPYINYNKCYYVVKNSTTTQLNSVSGEYNSWAAPVSITISGIGKKGEGLAQLPSIPDNKYIFRGRYFECTQAPQTYQLPTSGTYRMDCWGASGSSADIRQTGTQPIGGKGGYTRGMITLSSSTYPHIYVYVGEGSLLNDCTGTATFNGGGNGNVAYDTGSRNTRGGGATDFRLVNGAWNNAIGLRSRIMVAAGGGGVTDYGTYNGFQGGIGHGGAGGGLNGYDGNTIYKPNYYSTAQMNALRNAGGAAQTSTGTYWYFNPMLSQGVLGGFGYGGSAVNGWYNPGGGSGYYGGVTGGVVAHMVGSGSGGSSFISGHEGCDAIKDATGEVHTGQPNHYSGCIFINTEMIDGQGYKWTTTKGAQVNMLPPNSSTTKITGNSGEGYARIATPIVIGEQ